MAASSEAAALFSYARLEKPAKPLALPRLGVGMAGADNRYVKLNLCGASVFGAHSVVLDEPLPQTTALVYWQLRHFYFYLHGTVYLHIWLRIGFVYLHKVA